MGTSEQWTNLCAYKERSVINPDVTWTAASIHRPRLSFEYTWASHPRRPVPDSLFIRPTVAATFCNLYTTQIKNHKISNRPSVINSTGAIYKCDTLLVNEKRRNNKGKKEEDKRFFLAKCSNKHVPACYLLIVALKRTIILYRLNQGFAFLCCSMQALAAQSPSLSHARVTDATVSVF